MECYGDETGEAYAIVSEGTEPYEYIWEDDEGNILLSGIGDDYSTIDGLGAGTYYITVIDYYDCSTTEEFYINQADEPLYANAGSNASICSEMNDGFWELGGSDAFPTGSGGEPFYDSEEDEYYYEYHWTADPHDPSLEGQENEANPIVTPMETTTYTVEVTDAFGCKEYDSATIEVFPTVVADAGGDDENYLYICEGETINLGGSPLGEGNTGYYLEDEDIDPDQFEYNWRIIDPVDQFLSGEPHPEVSPEETTTYRVRVRDKEGDGCTDYDTVTVEVWEPIIVETIEDQELCNPNNDGDDITLGATITPESPEEGEYEYLWTADPEDPTLEGQENELEPTVSPEVTTTYTLNVSATAGIGCDGFDDVVITVHPEIIAEAGEDGVICDPEAETYQLGGDPTAMYHEDSPETEPGDFTYEWSAEPHDESLVGQENEPNPVVSPEETTEYYLTVFDEHGCSEMDTINITIADEVLAAEIDPDEVELDCYGDTYDAEIIVTGGISPYQFEWEPEAISQDDNEATLYAGDYTVIVTDSLGCEDIAEISITQPNELIINVTYADPSTINETDGYITAEITQETFENYDYILYQRDDEGWEEIASEENTDLLSHTFDNLGIGDYRVEVIDANNCMAKEEVTLSILEIELIVIDHVSCYGVCDGTLSLEINGDEDDIEQIKWYKDGDEDEYDMDPHEDPEEDYRYIELCAGSYEVIVEDTHGNEFSDSETITEPDPITIDEESLVVEHVSCYGSEDGIIDIQATGGTGDLEYTLYRNGTQIGETQTNDGEFTDLEPGIYTVSITDQNECGPTLSDEIEIIEPDEIELVLEAEPVCEGDLATIEASASKGYEPYEFTLWYDGSQIGDTKTAGENETVEFPDLNESGTYTVVVIDNNNCEQTENIEVIHHELPEATISYNDIDSADLCPEGTAEVTIETDDNIVDGSFSAEPDGLVFINDSGDINLDDSEPNTYTVEYIFSDDNNCTNVTSTVVTIHELPEVIVENDSIVCSPEDFEGMYIGGDSIEDYEYEWRYGPDDDLLEDQHDIANPFVNPDTTTTYTLTVTNEWACSATDTIQIWISDLEIVQLEDPIICEYEDSVSLGRPYQLDISGGMRPYSYIWTDMLGEEVSQNRVTRIERPIDPYYVFYLTDNKDCTISDTVYVRDIQTPEVELDVSPSATVLPGQTLTFTATPDDYHNYEFFVDDVSMQSGENNVFETAQIENQQEVQVIASYYGCKGASNIITITTRDIEEVNLPNAFIPDENANIENQTFGNYLIHDDKTIHISELDIELHLVVMSRWGQKIFEGEIHDDGEPWDGYYKGNRVSPGTYYYVATYYDSNNDKTQEKGSVTVVIPSE